MKKKIKKRKKIDTVSELQYDIKEMKNELITLNNSIKNLEKLILAIYEFENV